MMAFTADFIFPGTRDIALPLLSQQNATALVRPVPPATLVFFLARTFSQAGPMECRS